MASLRPAGALLGFAAAAAVAAVAGVAASVPPASAPPTFGQRLQPYAAEKAQIRDLPDGRRIAVGSRTGHDVTVQWRDAATHTWSKPQVVAEEKKFWTHDISVQRLGPTVSVAPDFWLQRVMDDDYAPSFTSIVVCRDYACSSSHASNHLSSATLAEKGDLVAFDPNDGTMLLWEHERGFRRTKITGIPRPSGRLGIRLMSDGTFIGIVGRSDGAKCRYALYTAGHHSTRFVKKRESPGFFGPQPCYLASVETKGDDQVKVWVESLNDEVTFRKRHGRWTLSAPSLRRMQIRDTRGKSTLATVEVAVGHHRQAIFGSPDMRRILYQHRASREEPWSKPTVIAKAPAGAVCRHATTTDIAAKQPAALVLVQCYGAERKLSREDEPADVGLVFATDDGEHWLRTKVQKPAWEPLYSRKRLVVIGSPRSLSYQPGHASFDVIKLPLSSTWDGLGLSLDGTHVLRIPGNADPKATCTASWSYAAITDQAWPAPTPFAAVGLPRPGTCTGSAAAVSSASFMVGLYQPEWSWQGEIEIRNGRPRLGPPLE